VLAKAVEWGWKPAVEQAGAADTVEQVGVASSRTKAAAVSEEAVSSLVAEAEPAVVHTAKALRDSFASSPSAGAAEKSPAAGHNPRFEIC